MSRARPQDIDSTYTDAMGVQRAVDPDVLDELSGMLGAPDDHEAAVPLVLRRPAPGDPVHAVEPVGRGVIELEDGSELDAARTSVTSLPLGYHRLHDDRGSRRVVMAPARCHLPPGWRAWGWATQLYSTRSTHSWGIGDLGDLSRLASWGRGQGADFLLVNPLGANSPGGPQQPSPYSPASRRFRNPAYLDVPAVPGFESLDDAYAREAAGRALSRAPVIDRDAAWSAKVDALRQIWDSGVVDPAFRGWVDGQGDDLAQFGTWSALCEVHGPAVSRWPVELRDAAGQAVRSAGRELRHRAEFHMWLQFLLERQLDDVGIPLVHDLPIGVDPDGFDAWIDRDLHAAGVSVGAPPDEFNTKGQDWGLPPFVPWKLRQAEYLPFIRTVRAGLSRRGGLRIDHVMGLFRLWWILPGTSPDRGAYVRYPAEDLLAILALESSRAEAVVVGEDLGTVEPGVREVLARERVLSYRLLWFEDGLPSTWPETSMAAITTHDLPTVAGLWDGSDLAAQHELGLDPNEEGTQEMRSRLARDPGLTDDSSTAEVVRSAHRQLATAPSRMIVATLEDAVADPARPNLPGADGARPNWSLPLPVLVDDLPDHPLATEVASILRASVHPEDPT